MSMWDQIGAVKPSWFDAASYFHSEWLIIEWSSIFSLSKSRMGRFRIGGSTRRSRTPISLFFNCKLVRLSDSSISRSRLGTISSPVGNHPSQWKACPWTSKRSPCTASPTQEKILLPNDVPSFKLPDVCCLRVVGVFEDDLHLARLEEVDPFAKLSFVEKPIWRWHFSPFYNDAKRLEALGRKVLLQKPRLADDIMKPLKEHLLLQFWCQLGHELADLFIFFFLHHEEVLKVLKNLDF